MNPFGYRPTDASAELYVRIQIGDQPWFAAELDGHVAGPAASPPAPQLHPTLNDDAEIRILAERVGEQLILILHQGVGWRRVSGSRIFGWRHFARDFLRQSGHRYVRKKARSRRGARLDPEAGPTYQQARLKALAPHLGPVVHARYQLGS